MSPYIYKLTSQFYKDSKTSYQFNNQNQYAR